MSLLKSCVFEVLLVRLSGLFDNQVCFIRGGQVPLLEPHLQPQLSSEWPCKLGPPFERAPHKKWNAGLLAQGGGVEGDTNI